MRLALTDTVIMLGVMVIIGLLGYFMDKQVDGNENK
jgi:uncharacterized membrane protein